MDSIATVLDEMIENGKSEQGLIGISGIDMREKGMACFSGAEG